jgi:hypothetical protein
MENFNDNLELTGDLLDEYLAIQEAELAQKKAQEEEEDFLQWCIDQEKD